MNNNYRVTGHTLYLYIFVFFFEPEKTSRRNLGGGGGFHLRGTFLDTTGSFGLHSCGARVFSSTDTISRPRHARPPAVVSGREMPHDEKGVQTNHARGYAPVRPGRRRNNPFGVFFVYSISVSVKILKRDYYTRRAYNNDNNNNEE